MNADLWVIFASLFLWSCGVGAYFFSWPLYAQSLGATPLQVGMLQSIMNIAMAASYLPGGILADRYERRIQLLIGWAMTVPVPLMYAYATDWRGLIPAAILYGLSAFNGPTINAYIADLAPRDRLASTVTTVWASIPLGMTLSPVLGGVIGQRYGMLYVFWIAFGLFLASTLLLFLARPNYPSGRHEADESVGFGVNPLKFFGSFIDHRLAWTIAFFVIVQLSINLTGSFFGPYLKDALGLDLVWVGILGAVSSVGAVALAPLMGRLADRAGTHGGLGTGLAVFAISCLLLTSGWGVPAALVAVFFRGTMDGLRGVMSAAISRRADRAHVGKAIATYNLLAGIGIAAAPALGGWLYDIRPDAPFLATAGASLLLAAACVYLFRLGRRSTTPGAFWEG